MAQLEYGKILDGLMTPEVVSALGNVREHRGRQELCKALQPATPGSAFSRAMVEKPIIRLLLAANSLGIKRIGEEAPDASA